MTKEEILQSAGVQERDFLQVFAAEKFCKFEQNGRRISRKRALELLGKEKYIQGLQRAAFHCTAAQIADDGTEVVFDCHDFFKN
jgi:hypothetical protein